MPGELAALHCCFCRSRSSTLLAALHPSQLHSCVKLHATLQEDSDCDKADDTLEWGDEGTSLAGQSENVIKEALCMQFCLTLHICILVCWTARQMC